MPRSLVLAATLMLLASGAAFAQGNDSSSTSTPQGGTSTGAVGAGTSQSTTNSGPSPVEAPGSTGTAGSTGNDAATRPLDSGAGSDTSSKAGPVRAPNEAGAATGNPPPNASEVPARDCDALPEESARKRCRTGVQ
jgi:hypothetical protein